MAQLEVLKWSNAFLNNLGAYIDAWGECCEFSKVCITTYYTVIIHPAAPEDRWVILTRLARRPTPIACLNTMIKTLCMDVRNHCCVFICADRSWTMGARTSPAEVEGQLEVCYQLWTQRWTPPRAGRNSLTPGDLQTHSRHKALSGCPAHGVRTAFQPGATQSAVEYFNHL